MQRRGSNTQSSTEQENIRPGLGKGTRTNSSDVLKARGVEPFPAVTEEANPDGTADLPPEEDISQAPSYDDAEKEELKDGSKLKEKARESVQMRPNAGVRQVSRRRSIAGRV